MTVNERTAFNLDGRRLGSPVFFGFIQHELLISYVVYEPDYYRVIICLRETPDILPLRAQFTLC